MTTGVATNASKNNGNANFFTIGFSLNMEWLVQTPPLGDTATKCLHPKLKYSPTNPPVSEPPSI